MAAVLLTVHADDASRHATPVTSASITSEVKSALKISNHPGN